MDMAIIGMNYLDAQDNDMLNSNIDELLNLLDISVKQYEISLNCSSTDKSQSKYSLMLLVRRISVW